MDDLGHVDLHGSRFLRALPAETLARLTPHLEPVELVRRQPIYMPGDEASTVFFINRGLVSLVKLMRDGRQVEVGAIGVEGALGLGALLGLGEAVLEAVVQLAGSAFKIKSAVLRDEAHHDHALADLLRRYSSVAIAQIAQTAACNRLHSLEQRCCRWLLIACDSAGEDTFQLTHESLALMLGVQRPGVSIAASALQQAGLIRYQNGRVAVIDRQGLEAGACECYDTVHTLFAGLYGP
ncbi:MAG: Crp/Fnr family transcriptional regulator [Caulobacteraceae bacterium]